MKDRILGDRYRLERPIGEGGMSVVWEAHDELLERPVAVKVLSSRYTADPGSRTGIHAEARAAAGLRHPHVTSVYDYGESTDEDGEPIPYVVMELLRGTSLAAVAADGPLPRHDALTVCAQIAGALAAAHAQGIVHRDVKPSNVMLTAAGVKVLDFGIAAAIGQNEVYDARGRIMGTPAYVAPERLTGTCVLPATDVYALGLLMFRLLTGDNARPPSEVRARPAPLPSSAAPPDVAELYRACVASEPAERPSAETVAMVLSAASTSTVDPDVSPMATMDLSVLPVGRPSALSFASRPGPAYQPTSAYEPTEPWRDGAVKAAVFVGGAVAAATILMLVVLSGPSSSSSTPGPRADESIGLVGNPAAPAVAADAPTGPPPTVATDGAPNSGQTFRSAGGQVGASCAGSRARLSWWDAATGFVVRNVDPGPAREAEVEFAAGKRKVNMTVRCLDGRPTVQIKT